MKATTLVLRGLTYYWRTNVAVVAGVATAVAVLAGALLVGDSVRGSLRDLVLQRLGRTDRVLVSSGFFREALPDAGEDVAGVRDDRHGIRGRVSDDRRRGVGAGSGQRPARVEGAGVRRRR